MDQATTEVMWPLRPRAQAVGVLVDGVLEERDGHRGICIIGTTPTAPA
jgi:hypothetical protein